MKDYFQNFLFFKNTVIKKNNNKNDLSFIVVDIDTA